MLPVALGKRRTNADIRIGGLFDHSVKMAIRRIVSFAAVLSGDKQRSFVHQEKRLKPERPGPDRNSPWRAMLLCQKLKLCVTKICSVYINISVEVRTSMFIKEFAQSASEKLRKNNVNCGFAKLTSMLHGMLEFKKIHKYKKFS